MPPAALCRGTSNRRVCALAPPAADKARAVNSAAILPDQIIKFRIPPIPPWTSIHDITDRQDERHRRFLIAPFAGPAPERHVPEEKVWNYEGGIKGRAGRFTGARSVFYQIYDDFQISVIQPGGVSITQSAGSARNVGVELEGTLRLADYLSVFGAFAHIDGNITDKRYLIDAGNTGGSFGIPTYIAGEPRFYGVELGAKF